MRNCTSCRDWKGCLGKEWFEPSDFHTYCWYQCIFLIEHLEDDTYPRPVSGYVFAKNPQPQRRPHAPFENIKVLTGEIGVRLKSTGEAGEALVDEVQSGIVNPMALSRPARRALNYIVGTGRRKQTYSEWKSDRQRRIKWRNLTTQGGKFSRIKIQNSSLLPYDKLLVVIKKG